MYKLYLNREQVIKYQCFRTHSVSARVCQGSAQNGAFSCSNIADSVNENPSGTWVTLKLEVTKDNVATLYFNGRSFGPTSTSLPISGKWGLLTFNNHNTVFEVKNVFIEEE